MEALLAAYRIGARVAWRRVAEAGARRRASSRDTLVLLAESIFAYIDELSAESAEGYAREQAELAGEAERRRRVLLDLLIRCRRPTRPPSPRRADAAHWPLPRELAALVWSADAAAEPARRLPLDAIVVAARRRAVRTRSRPRGAGPSRRARARCRGHAGRPWARWSRGRTRRSRCAGPRRRSAWPATARRPAGLAADEHRAALVLRAERRLIDDLALDRLAPLAGETERSRARLTETLRAWLRHDGSVSGAAEELHLHPQTVRYRLGRLRQRFGPALDDPDARFELELVLRGVLSRT